MLVTDKCYSPRRGRYAHRSKCTQYNENLNLDDREINRCDSLVEIRSPFYFLILFFFLIIFFCFCNDPPLVRKNRHGEKFCQLYMCLVTVGKTSLSIFFIIGGNLDKDLIIESAACVVYSPMFLFFCHLFTNQRLYKL